MIRAEETGAPTEHVLKRSAKMKAKLLFQVFEGERVTEVEVESDDPDKPPNIVIFHELPDGIHILCFRKETETVPQRNCPKNKYRGLCSHAYAAIRLLIEDKGDTDASHK